jgi:hypothetical protein
MAIKIDQGIFHNLQCHQPQQWQIVAPTATAVVDCRYDTKSRGSLKVLYHFILKSKIQILDILAGKGFLVLCGTQQSLGTWLYRRLISG